MQSKRVIVILLLFCCVTVGYTQKFSTDYWHKGRVVLFEGDTLVGKVKYDLENQTVQYSKDGETIKAFSPRKLLAFELYDELFEAYRKFYVLPYSSQGNYESPFIFELSYEGPHMSLLRSENVETVVRSLPYMYSSYTSEEMVYTYYFINKAGDIQEFDGKKRDLYRILSSHDSEIKQLVKSERLKLDRLDHLVRICSYYNSLF